VALEFKAFADGDLLDERRWNAEILNENAAEDFDAALGDRAHHQLGMTGDRQRADEKDVERSAEACRDLVGDRDPASGKSEHDHLRVTGVLGQLGRQPPSRIDSIMETHDSPLVNLRRGESWDWRSYGRAAMDSGTAPRERVPFGDQEQSLCQS
jgi:hypothetical protein